MSFLASRGSTRALLFFVSLLSIGAHAQLTMCPEPNIAMLPVGLSTLNFPKAWRKICGTAYVGVIDNGIEAPGGVIHQDLQGRVRTQLSGDCRSGSLCPVGQSPSSLDETLIEGARGHGTHTAGLIGAKPNVAQTTAGGCRNCSLSILKFGVTNVNDPAASDIKARALRAAMAAGAQVVNMSFDKAGLTCPSTLDFCNALNPPSERPVCALRLDFCNAINEARERDIMMVASSGNDRLNAIGFPANQEGVLAVGGSEPSGAFWDGGLTDIDGNPPSDFGSNRGPEQFLIAPATRVFSTFYTNATYSVSQQNPDLACADPGDSYIGLVEQAGYGRCSGTSMSAPYVTAAIALTRSANPMLVSIELKDILSSTASNSSARTIATGWGYPNVAAAVDKALSWGGTGTEALVRNRTTALFSAKRVDETDRVYSVVPQAIMSAYMKTLMPPPILYSPDADYHKYLPDGDPVPGYPMFPCGGFSPCPPMPPPAAIATVFTTSRSPVYGGVELVPLYRLSRAEQTRTSHYYTTDPSSFPGFEQNQFFVDGIEGFVYPATTTQAQRDPASVALCLAVWSTQYRLFLGTGGANPVCDMVAAGIPNPQNYVNYGIIGFAFPVGAPRVFYSQPLPPTPFVNGSFEGPAYSGSAGASATGWQVTQVITNSYLSAYGYPLAPHGNQVAWGGDIRQTLNLAPGTYTMSYRALGRVNQPTTMFLKVNDEIKDTFVPSSQSWTLRTVTFGVDEEQSTFAFISSGAFIDDVKFVVPCPTPNAAPVVTWLAPLDQSHFIVGQTINLAVTATDSDGLINKVEFYDGMDPTPFATVFGPLPNGSQYAYPWPTTSSNLGSHHITAIVTDTCGAETPSTRIIYVDPTPNLLTNGGFESPPTSNVGGMPTGWQGSGGTVGNGYLGATPAPEGQQAAYTRSSISQTVSLNGGNYTLTYKAMTRWYDAPVPLTVRVNGVQLASCTTLNTAWVTCPTVTLTGLAAGQYNIEFVGEGGSFLFVDDARLTAD